jgi:hypothetical protein
MSLELIDLVRKKLAALNAPASCVAALAGVSISDVSLYLNSQRSAPPEKAMRLYNAALKLETLAGQLSEIPLDYRRADVLKRVLERIDAGDLRVIVTNGIEEPRDLQQHQ